MDKASGRHAEGSRQKEGQTRVITLLRGRSCRNKRPEAAGLARSQNWVYEGQGAEGDPETMRN